MMPRSLYCCYINFCYNCIAILDTESYARAHIKYTKMSNTFTGTTAVRST